MKSATALLLLALVSPAFAQQQAPQTPNEQALIAEMQAQQGAKLGCFAEIIRTREDLAKALARVKELEAVQAKPEAKPN